MECLISCDQGSDNTSLNLWNPSSGTKLLSLRGPSAQPNSLCNINDEGFCIVEAGKPFIHFWQTGYPLQTSRRILCPGKPGATAVFPGGHYIAVGIDEKISIWQVASGRIVASVSTAHFRPVTILKFSTNGTFLISGGQDGLVHVWNFLQLVANASSSSSSTTSTTPTYTWSDHSLPITGLHVGAGGQKATIYTCSLDRTCKIYSLITGTLLLSISFPIALTSIVTDPAGNSVYLGAKNGLIYQIQLQSPPRSIEHHILSDAAADFLFKKHNQEITSLAISTDGKILVSGDEEGNIYMWDVPSKQSIRTIQQQIASSVANNSDGTKNTFTKKVTNLLFWLGNPENLKGTKKPSICFPDVPKLLDAQQNDSNADQSVIKIWTRCKQQEEQQLGGSSRLPDGYSAKLAEISKLKMELTKNQIINKKLHEFCTASILDLPHEKRITTNDNSTSNNNGNNNNNSNKKKRKNDSGN